MGSNDIRYLHSELLGAILAPMNEYNFGEDIEGVSLPALSEDISDDLKRATAIPRGLSRANVAAAFHNAFELIGGVPRLAIWAHQNQTDFYKLYSRLLPSAAQTDFGGVAEQRRIVHSLPPSALDGVVSLE